MVVKYRIKNWEKFQHYKDRNPPWIKLHVETLSSADWVTLADASKLLMVVCMILASKEQGVFVGDLDYIRRVAYLDKRPDLTPLIKCGFIEEVLADASASKQPQADVRPEKEAEAEKEKKETPIAPKGASRPDGFDRWYLGTDVEGYAGYPHKVAVDAAIRAWEKRRKAGTLPGVEVLIAATRAYVARKPADVAWANPATWLNGGRWQDEPALLQAVMPIAPAPKIRTDDEWTAVILQFLKTGNWPPTGYGTQPGFSGCMVPKHLIAKFNLDGMTPPNGCNRLAS